MFTWNAGGIKAAGFDCIHSLFTGGNIKDELCDIYAFAMQEAQPLNITLLIGSTDNLKKWDDIIDKEFMDFIKKSNSPEKYFKERMVYFGGLYLSVYTKSTTHDMVKNVGEFANGFKALLKNKGACGITLKIGENRVCFINCHLTAFQEKVRERVENVQEIEKMKFIDTKKNTYTLKEHDYVLWAGDMNFRVGNISSEAARDKVLSKSLPFLLEKDQLFKERNKGNIFKVFNEPPIKFNPTYKYVKGKSDYDV